MADRPPSDAELDGDGTIPAVSVAQASMTMPPIAEPHPDAEEILRQVEHYFSDENLPSDSHLLAKTGGDGNGAVSIKHILGFPKMRKYKPKSQVIASLRLSQKIRIVNNKEIQRRVPLTAPLRVEPKLGEQYKQSKVLQEKPWLTKGMLKPTGFEEYANDGPIRPEDYERERALYDPTERFDVRIESAIARYEAKRKMHERTRDIFHKFMFYGGFDTDPNQFGGGVKVEEMEDRSKDDILQATSRIVTAEQVLDGLDAHEQPDGKATWVVDFETIAKGFLSSCFMSKFAWYDQETRDEACTVMTNFYNYLMYHDVCPEYNDQILKARSVCTLAQIELPELWEVDRGLPGQFNMACCGMFGNSWAALPSKLRWGETSKDDTHPVPLTKQPFFRAFATGIMAYGTEEQMVAVEKAAEDGLVFKTIFSEDVGFEITRIEHLGDSSAAKEVYSIAKLQSPLLHPLGKLHCKSWKVPHAPPQDVSPEHRAFVQAKLSKPWTFLVDEAVLEHCRLGMKIQASVCELDIGIRWIDHIEKVYPSFYEWTGNEIIRTYKPPGPPKAWMQRRKLEKAAAQKSALGQHGMEAAVIEAGSAS